MVGEECEQRFESDLVAAVVDFEDGVFDGAEIPVDGTDLLHGFLSESRRELRRRFLATVLAVERPRRDAAGRYAVIMSEAAEQGTGAEARRKNWASAMAGAQVMVLGMDIAETPVSDLEDCGRLAGFFESADWRGMEPHDELAAGGTDYVLAEPVKRYIAYASELRGEMSIAGLASGDYTLRWFDCVTGARVTQRDVRVTVRTEMFTKPPGIGRECAVYVVRVSY